MKGYIKYIKIHDDLVILTKQGGNKGGQLFKNYFIKWKRICGIDTVRCIDEKNACKRRRRTPYDIDFDATYRCGNGE